MSKLKITLFTLGLFFSINGLMAQMSGVYNIPSDFPTVAAATASLNSVGVNGPVTLNIPAAYTETVPVGGITFSATGTAANTITFQKSGVGANPILYAYAGGTATPASAIQDGVFRLVGSDYVTINGLDIMDPNVANPATMEYGYALYKANAADGCQNNTIMNCNITLNRINNATGTAPAVDGSRGIDVMNALPTSNNAVVTVTVASGSNSNNKFYSNTIQNCNIGIALIGYAASTPFTLADNGNDVGGSSGATGNNIINFGGGAAATNPCAGVRTLAQYNINVSYNSLNNNNGSGVNHVNIIRGIYLNTATSANATISNNSLTINGGGTTSQISVIENASGSTAASNTINITNNVISNCTYVTQTSGTMYFVYNSASAAYVNMNNNSISGLSLNPANGTGGLNLIYNSATVGSALSISSNTVQNLTNLNTSGTIYTMYNSTSTNNYTVQGNYENNISRAGSLTGTMYGFYNFGSPGVGAALVTNNIFSNISPGGGANTYYGIYQASTTSQTETVTNNTISAVTGTNSTINGIWFSYGAVGSLLANNIVNNLAGGAAVTGINIGGSSAPLGLTANSNTVNTISSTGAFSVIGMLFATGSNVSAFKNKIYDISVNNASGSVYGIHIPLTTSTNTLNLFNNTIGDLRAPITNNGVGAIIGINVTSNATNGNINVFYNTVYINASSTGTNFGTSGIFHTSNATATSGQLTLRNNIIINNSTQSGTGIVAAYRRSTATLNNFNAASNNNNFYGGTPGPANLVYYDGTNSFQNLPAYQALVTPRDAASITENTTFLSTAGVSPTFLHVDPSSSSLTESGAVNIAGITDDFDGDIRQGNIGYGGTGTAPDIGADEYNSILAACSGASSGTISPLSINKCTGQTATMGSTGFTTGSGIVYQWQVGNTPGGPYSNVSGGVGANSPSFTTGTLTPGTYYYVLVTTCTITSATGTSNEATVTVNAIPTASVSSNSPVCAGQPLNLNGGTDIGTSFMWTGPNNYTSTTQNPVVASANLTSGGVYNLLVSTASCTAALVSTTVSVGVAPPAITVTPTSTMICNGFSVNVNVTSGGNDTLNFGTQATQNTASTSNLGYPAPYTVYYGGQRMQTLISAAELTAAGFMSGSQINSVQFPVVSLGTNWGTSINDLKSFQVNIGATTFTSLTSFQGGLTNVVAPMNFTPTVGYNNTHMFATPYYWDGVSNLILETSFSNNILGATGDLVTQYNSPTTFTSTIVYRVDSQTPASVASNTTVTFMYMARPDLKLNGTSMSTYSWSPSSSLSASTGPSVTATPSASTIYTVTSANGVCTSNAAVSVSVVPSPTIAIAATSTLLCGGGSSTLTASGATSYTWSTGSNSTSVVVSPSVATTYTARGDNGACNAQTTITINSSANPTVTAITSNSLLCTGQSATLNATGTATTYSWSTGGSGNSITVSPTITTTYSVTGTNPAGCFAIAMVTQSVSTCTGINELNAAGISVYPNPNNGLINVAIPSEMSANASIEIFDAVGKLIVKEKLTRDITRINLSDLANGVYVYKIYNNTEPAMIGRMIKQ